MAFLLLMVDPSLGAFTFWHFCDVVMAPVKLAGAREKWRCRDADMAPLRRKADGAVRGALVALCKNLGALSKWHFCGLCIAPCNIMLVPLDKRVQLPLLSRLHAQLVHFQIGAFASFHRTLFAAHGAYCVTLHARLHSLSPRG